MTELSSGGAFFTLLDISEQRLTRVRRQRYGVRLLQSAIVVLALVALLGSAVALLRVADSEPVPAGWLGAAACAALAALATWIFAQRPAGRRLSTDEHQMIEDVNRLREVLAHFARREGWDDGLIRSVRKRLSAFPLRAGGEKETP